MAQRLGQTQLVELLLEQVPVCNAETSAAVKGADLAPLYGATRRSSCARARPERAQRAGPASGPSLGVALSESWRPKRRAGGARTAGGSTAGEVGMRNSREYYGCEKVEKSWWRGDELDWRPGAQGLSGFGLGARPTAPQRLSGRPNQHFLGELQPALPRTEASLRARGAPRDRIGYPVIRDFSRLSGFFRLRRRAAGGCARRRGGRRGGVAARGRGERAEAVWGAGGG